MAPPRKAFAAGTALARERATVIDVCLACRTRVAMACKSMGRLVMVSVCRSGSTRRTKMLHQA
jgi:hypothetical protein